MAADELLKEGEAVEKDATEKVRNLQPPDMIRNANDLEVNSETTNATLASLAAAQGWKAPVKSRNGDLNRPYPKWFKCKYCRCKCTPPFKKCECPCSQHKATDCPNKESTEKDNVNKQCLAETLRVNNILITFLAEDEECFKGDSSFNFETQTQTTNGKITNINWSRDVVTTYFNEDSKQVHNGNEGSKVIIDSGASLTLAGLEWTKNYFEKLPEAIKANIYVEKSEQKFQFGGGEIRKSMGAVNIPAYVLDDEYQAHMIIVKADIVEANLPLLFGAKSLDNAEASMKFGENPYLISEKVFGAGTRIPLRRDGGHYVFSLFPPTEIDNNLASAALINPDTCSKKKAECTISYVTKEENPTYQTIQNEKILLSKRYKRQDNSSELTRKDIIKLHHFFGHCTVQRLEKLIQKAGKWKPEHSKILEEISKCQVCAVEAIRKT